MADCGGPNQNEGRRLLPVRPVTPGDPDSQPFRAVSRRPVVDYTAVTVDIDPAAVDMALRMQEQDEQRVRQEQERLARRILGDGWAPSGQRFVDTTAWMDGDAGIVPRPNASHLFLPEVHVDPRLPDNVIEMRGPGGQRVRLTLTEDEDDG